MTVIRFSRQGTKKKPIYRMVVQDSRSPRDGRFIENLGIFNPLKGPSTLSIKRDRLEYWLSTGAQMSDSVRTLLKKAQPVAEGAVAEAPAPKPAKKSKAATKEA